MKILALVTEAYGGGGGIAQSNRDLLGALAAEHEVTVLARRGEGPAPAGIRPLAPRAGRIAYSAAAFRALAARFDAVFCGHLFMAPLALALSVAARAPYWLHLHGIEAWPKPRASVAAAAGRAALVTCVSRCTRRRVLSWLSADPERCKVLPNTVSERFSPGPKNEALAGRWGLRGKKVLLTVGRLSPAERYKGHDRVIGVLPEVARRVPEAAYLVVGEGRDRARLERLALEAGVAGRVVFAGAVEDAELPDVYRSADAFVMPSDGEGFGIAFLEAAASGIPVVAGSRDGSADPLVDGLAGTLVDPDDRGALLEGILAALGSRSAGSPVRFARAPFERHVRALACRLAEGARS